MQLLSPRLEKQAIMVEDLPGFVSNRISHLFMNEAAFVLQDNVATAEKIDMIFKKCFGHKMGPLETADLIGLDTVVHSLDVLYESYQDPKYRCSPLLRKLVHAGHLGRKRGRGFLVYPKGKRRPEESGCLALPNKTSRRNNEHRRTTNQGNSTFIPATSNLDEDDHLFESGILNSLFAVQLMTFIEKALTIEVGIDDLDIENFKSIHATTAFVLKKMPDEPEACSPFSVNCGGFMEHLLTHSQKETPGIQGICRLECGTVCGGVGSREQRFPAP